jgi:two-component system chemotaxis response regulator CheB
LALARIPIVHPDLVTLDIEMPVMDGLETLRQIRKLHPGLRVVMFSTLTQRGASETFEALSLGADDYVAKAANGGSLDRSLTALRTELIPKVKQFFSFSRAVIPATSEKVVPQPARSRTRHGRVRAIAIGASTGGPQALAELISHLPGNLPVPVLVVQHMPPMFTRFLAERLKSISALLVEEAEDGMKVCPGTVIIARGDHHLRVKRNGNGFVTELNQEGKENFCRPAVDVLFRSMAEAFGGDVVSVVLTGMGSDGLRGTEVLKAAGAYCLAQDEETSVVWGMPGAVVRAWLADQILRLSQVAPALVSLVTA